MKCPDCDGKNLSCETCGGLGEMQDLEPKTQAGSGETEQNTNPILPISHDPL